jgi:myo-inositol 2-dehydrogenase / D-chiro-inositol 1-dehydrogenase
MDTLRVAVVGTGWIAASHLRELKRAGDVEVVAVCDLDADRAAAFASEAGGRVYGRIEELLDNEGLGAVFLCTPPATHADLALAVLERGVPLYLEKPIARTLEDAARIVEAAAASGTVCTVGYQWHALDLLEDVAELLEGDEIGLLVGTSIGPTASRPWFIDRKAGGGNLLERGSHHLDLARTVAGEVRSVSAAASRVRLARHGSDEGDIDDALTMLLKMDSGALATVVIAWTRSGEPGTYALDVVAAAATLRLGLDPDFTLTGTAAGKLVSRKARSHPSEASVRRFLAAARERDPASVVCPPADAIRTLAVAVAAEEALETGTPVPVADVQ